MVEPNLLIVDDEPEVLDLLVRTLTDHHLRCIPATSVQEGKIALESGDVDLVICDLALGDGSGLDLLRYIRCIRPSLPVIIITGFPSIHVAEESLRLGAFDLIEKPFDITLLTEVVTEAVATRQQQIASLGETLSVIDRPAAFVDRRNMTLATNARWDALLGPTDRPGQRSIDDYVAADSPVAISDLLVGLGTSDTAQGRVRLALESGTMDVDLTAVPFRERREQPGGYLITVSTTDDEADDETHARDIAADALTGCLSHRGFLEALDHMRLAALRRSLPVTIMVVDIDDFGHLNQTHGYELGDRLLQNVADEIRRVVRDEDRVGRCGPDEFAVALYETTGDGAVAAAKRLCAALSTVTYDIGGVSLPISLTIGLAECPAGYTVDNRGLLEQAMAAVDWARQHHHEGPIVRYGDGMAPPGERLAVDRQEVQRLTDEFAAANENFKASYVESARALVAAVEAKDPYTRRHSEAVARYAERLAADMKLPEQLRRSIRYAAVLHDVGKIGVPDRILTKPGPLAPEERQLIEQHPVIGANIVSHVSCMRREVPFIQHHHENWDGSGYPAGLVGSVIPLAARILRIADSFDALLSARSYKTPMEWADAVAEIRAGAGTLYDPRVVAAMESIFNKGAPSEVAASTA